ncbi:MAG TPA: DUF6687 family protein [Acidimicrobiales bacterium]|nr:DUF6687 family protein [Acidimicrobiales bacterium]
MSATGGPHPVTRRYVPAHLLDGRPHVMVDGAPRPGTVCTLSHWPGTPTPEPLRADLSAEIVRLALGRPDLVGDVEAVTVDHYDEDGVVSLAMMVLDDLADEHGDLLVEVARVGDFGVVTDRRAALVAFALAALADPERTPVEALRPGRRPDGWLEVCGLAAAEALVLLPALVASPEDHADLWGDEARAYDAACEALRQGAATIEELPDADLAVVRVDRGSRSEPAGEVLRAAAWGGRPLHPAAVHSATSCLRVATIDGSVYEVRYRYESWVRLRSRRPRPRVDLSPLAAALSGLEGAGARWSFDGAGAITPALAVHGGPSTLDPERFVELVVESLAALDAGPAAWDPYRIPAGA